MTPAWKTQPQRHPTARAAERGLQGSGIKRFVLVVAVGVFAAWPALIVEGGERLNPYASDPLGLIAHYDATTERGEAQGVGDH